MLVELAGTKFPTTLTMQGVQKIIAITKYIENLFKIIFLNWLN